MGLGLKLVEEVTLATGGDTIEGAEEMGVQAGREELKADREDLGRSNLAASHR